MSIEVTLIEKIIAEQEALGMNENQFAIRLGVSRGQWWFVRRGLRKPSAAFLSKVMKEFPKLTIDIMNYLAGKQETINA
jgi:transcriptional regulator with XRE-family HTH domain